MDINLIFEHAPVLLFTKDDNNTFIKVNQHAADLWGLTIKELEGTSLYDILPKEEATFLHMNDLEVIKSGEPKKGIVEPLSLPNGTTKYYRVDKVPLKTKDGTITGIMGFAWEITSDLKTQEELVLARKAMQQASSTIVIADINGDITFVNDKFSRVTGYTYQEVIGKNPRILNSGKMPQDKYKKLWETLSRGETWRGEFINKTKHGEFYWELATISPVFDDGGKITHYVKVAEVLSEIKDSVLNMWNVLESANYYVVIFDKELRIVLCNKLFADVLGVKETLDVVGNLFTDYVSEDDAYIFKTMQVHVSNPKNQMSEFLSELIDSERGVHMVKWFNSWINTHTNWTFCFGVPIKEDISYSESVGIMRERFKDTINVHRNLINEFKEEQHKENLEKEA